MKELRELLVKAKSKKYENTADTFYEAGDYLEAAKQGYKKAIEIDEKAKTYDLYNIS